MAGNQAARVLRRKCKKLERKLNIAEGLVGILRDYILRGGRPAVESGSVSARAETETAAGKRRRSFPVAGGGADTDRDLDP